jgi:hypothetical protein
MVLNDPKPVMGGAFISWHVHCYNSAVKTVRILFDQDKAKYFKVRQPDHSEKLEKKLEKGLLERNGKEAKEKQDATPNLNYKAECVIWGQAPVHSKSEYREGGAQQIVEKYTVYGLDDKGKELVSLDPEIINDKPRGGGG